MATPTAGRRLVAVGASNLARLALPLLDTARDRAGGPIEAHFALGRGRSYGLRSNLLGRGLASLRDSGLWRTLADATSRPTTAVLLDVGNDLLYGVDVPRILEWAEDVARRLAAHADECIVVGLPLASIRLLPAWRFHLVRTVLVPQSRLQHAEALAASGRLDDGLRAIAARVHARFAEPRGEWYGVDPIHVRTRWFAAATRDWLGAGAAPTTTRHASPWARLRFVLAAPAAPPWFGRRTTTTQPVRTFGDGSTVHLW